MTRFNGESGFRLRRATFVSRSTSVQVLFLDFASCEHSSAMADGRNISINHTNATVPITGGKDASPAGTIYDTLALSSSTRVYSSNKVGDELVRCTLPAITCAAQHYRLGVSELQNKDGTLLSTSNKPIGCGQRGSGLAHMMMLLMMKFMLMSTST